MTRHMTREQTSMLGARKASGNTNAFLILGIFAFYIFIIVMLGLIGESQLSTNKTITTPENPDGFSFLSQIGYFLSGVGFAITSIPLWANTLLFLPISVTMVYIILSYFRGSS